VAWHPSTPTAASRKEKASVSKIVIEEENHWEWKQWPTAGILRQFVS
jgi:hypothetical protein